MIKTRKLIFTIVTAFSLNLFAHGEDKPGPHGGYIRMPGTFHTEVVKEKNGFRIYLLDINWKNPSVLDSSVTAFIQLGKKKTDLACEKMTDSYFCSSKLKEKGELNIIAKREGQMGDVSSYKLPLKFEIPKKEMPDHMSH